MNLPVNACIVVCKRCGYAWVSTSRRRRTCPNCKSYRWDSPKSYSDSTAHFFSGFPEFESKLEVFYSVNLGTIDGLKDRIYSGLLAQLLANAEDIYYFCKELLGNAIINYQLEAEDDIKSKLGFMTDVNSSEYKNEYFKIHGIKPPHSTLEQLSKKIDNSLRHQQRLDYLAKTVEIAYKPFFFFVRSYQDTYYRVILRLVNPKGNSSGNRSMTSAFTNIDSSDRIKTSNPVGEILSQQFPAYGPWFHEFRAKRNDVKTGVQLEAYLEDADPSVMRRSDSFGDAFRNFTDIQSLIRALDACTRLSQITREIK